MTPDPTAGGPGSPAPPEVAVGAIILDDDRLLLVRRGREPARGRWSVPGGRVEAGEALARAVEREVGEETGLVVTCGRFVGWVERIGSGHHFVILDFEATLDPGHPDQTPVAADDADEVAWVPLGDLAGWPLVDGLADFLVEHGYGPR